MSLLFNTLTRFVIAFLLGSNHLLISWLQSLLCSDFRAQEEEICHGFHPFPFYLPWSDGMGLDAMILVFFLIFNFRPAFSLSSFTFIKRFFRSSLLSAVEVVSSAYLRLLMFLPPILIPAYNSSSPAFLIMCSAYRLNKQGDNRQPYGTPFSILNQSVVSYRVLTVAFWPIYRFLRRQLRWYGISISLRASHSLLWCTQSKALS